MAISVDRAFRTVLRILNKESRGTVTPDEFAKIGQQVQLELIDRAFYDYNNALNSRKGYQSNLGYANIPSKIREKIDALATQTSISFSGGTATLPTNTLRILDISSSDRTVRYEEISKNELSDILRSPLTAPSASFPLFVRNANNTTVSVYPNEAPLTTATVIVDYIGYPTVPRWGYLVNAVNGAKIYDANTYTENSLVIQDNAVLSFETNITNGIDGEYDVDISNGEETFTGSVVVQGNVVTSLSITGLSPSLSVGDTLTVGRTTSLPANGDIPVTSLTGDDLTFLVTSSLLYSGSTAGSTNFVLHESEEINLIKGILAYMGITLGDADITAQATAIMQADQISKQ